MDKEIHKNLGPLVGMIHRAMRRQINRRLVESGNDVTAEQLIIMFVLDQHSGYNQQLIAEICGKDKTSTTRMIDTMERNGLLRRVPDSRDRRQKLIHLTEKGRSEQAGLMKHIVATHVQGTQGISPEELELCKDVLGRVLANLIEVDPTWPGPRPDRAGAQATGGQGSQE